MGKTLTIVALVLALAPAALADTHDVLPVYVDSPAGVDVEFSWSGHSDRHVLARSLRVLTTPRRPSDALPSEILQFARPTPGITPLTRRSHLLVSVGRRQVYAYPTREGDVCVYLVPLGGGQCDPAMMDGALPQVERGLVWGLVDNAATRVGVRIGRHSVDAHLGRNAFLLRLPGGVRAPTQIVVYERGGTRHVYTIKRCRVQNVTPLTGSAPLAPPPC